MSENEAEVTEEAPVVLTAEVEHEDDEGMTISLREETARALPTRVLACEHCADHWRAEGEGLVAAMASVGLERGKSTWEMAEGYFDHYHGNDHKERQPPTR